MRGQSGPRSTAVAILPSRANGYQSLKRVIDFTVAALLLLLLAPLTIGIALVIRMDSPGSALFRQKRVGLNGRQFVVHKFRSMRRDADDNVHVAAFRKWMSDRPLADGDSAAFKLKDDLRVTRVGALLRKTSLDELPQLLNVLKGEMSLVGPRPPIPYEVAMYEDWHRRRLTVKPGITGLWQVTARGSGNFDNMVRLDLEYIDRQSLGLDLHILAMTIPAVFSGKGAR